MPVFGGGKVKWKPAVMENQMENKMENEIETGVILG